jgi:phospho-N-acetylmuramoyl-pentapeptide-transferase
VRVRTLLFAAGVSLMVSLLGTKILIDVLTLRKIGQPIREDGPEGHFTKAGTPTMGGAAIVGGAVVGYLASDISNRRIITRSGLVVMMAVVGAGLVGLADDWIKVTRERNLGLTSRTKFLGLLVVAIAFALLALSHTPVSTDLSFTRADSLVDLGQVGWSVWAVLLIVATTNAVNLTDGLDGLAAGVTAIVALGLVALCFISGNMVLASFLNEMHLPGTGELVIFAAALAAACAGFLWFNGYPASVFMGDTGALSLGAAIGTLTLMIKKELLLPLLCMVFFLETVSVIIQTNYFKYTKKKTGTGKRVFRMAPLHHHFEARGIPETKIVLRFWIITAITVIATLLMLRIR